jgi:hypothetical protein
MAFYTNLSTPETWGTFIAHGKNVSGFRDRQRRSAERIKAWRYFCLLRRSALKMVRAGSCDWGQNS